MSHFCPIPVADRALSLPEGRTRELPEATLSAEVAERLRRALLGGETHYTARPGIPELRAAVRERLLAAGLGGAGEVVITAGREEALFVALAGAREAARDEGPLGDRVGGGGRVLLPAAAARDPAFLAACGALDLQPTTAADDPAARVAAVGLLDAPADPASSEEANPEGATSDRAISDRADGGALRVLDLGDGLRRLAAGALAEVGAGTVLVGSLDGWPALAGFRVGFFFAPTAALLRLRGLKQAISICTAAPSQRAAALVLGAKAPTATPPPAPGAAESGKRAAVKDDARYSLMELAARLPGVVSLGRGDPDADAPAEVIEAAGAAAGTTEALDPRGQARLREAIARREAERTGVEWDPEREVLVTGGAQEGIAAALLALVGPEEEVLLADPRYTSYETAIRLARGRMAPVRCGPDRGDLPPGGRGADFGMRADRTGEALARTTRPRLLVVVNFQNPTGARTRSDEVESLCRLADRHHLWVLSDEVYAEMALDGEGPIRSPSAVAGMRNRTLTLGSVSKTWAMTGFRIGYLTGPADAVAACARVRAAISGPSPLFSQRAAAAALRDAGEFPAGLRALYAPRRRLLLDGLASLGLPVAAHGGGFFVWADISRFGMPAAAFCRRLLLEARVLVFPGTAFGESWGDRVRISMLQSEDSIEEALTRLRRFAAASA